MSILTFENAPSVAKRGTAQAREPSPKTVPNAKGFWSRLFDRLIEARARQVEEYMARHPGWKDVAQRR